MTADDVRDLRRARDLLRHFGTYMRSNDDKGSRELIALAAILERLAATPKLGVTSSSVVPTEIERLIADLNRACGDVCIVTCYDLRKLERELEQRTKALEELADALANSDTNIDSMGWSKNMKAAWIAARVALSGSDR